MVQLVLGMRRCTEWCVLIFVLILFVCELLVVICFLCEVVDCFFFFSSRRRHTRLQGDWSSDVCSSDLLVCAEGAVRRVGQAVGARCGGGAAHGKKGPALHIGCGQAAHGLVFRGAQEPGIVPAVRIVGCDADQEAVLLATWRGGQAALSLDGKACAIVGEIGRASCRE